MPLLWVMKGSYFGFEMHAWSKTLSFSYNMHLFLPYLLNDSQTIHSTIHFSKLLLFVTLLCSDWSNSFQCCFVYSVTAETAIFKLQKRHLVAKNELAFSFRPMRKEQQVGGEYANDSCWRQTGIGFKNDSFQWFRVDSFFWETITLYTELFQMFSFTYCMKDHLHKYIIEAL